MVQTILNAPKMSPENFCYWLQGLFELQPDLKTLTPEQVQMIKQHLAYVFEGKYAYTQLSTPGTHDPRASAISTFTQGQSMQSLDGISGIAIC